MERIQKWMEWLRKEKSVKIACLLGAVGVLCICFSEWPTDKKAEEKEAVITTEEYCNRIETRLSGLLTKMEGVGACQVYVTLENGVEYVYAKAQKENVDHIKDSNQSGEKLTEKEDTEQNVVVE